MTRRMLDWLRQTHTPLHVAFARPWPSTRRGLKLWFFAVIIGCKGFAYTQTPPGTSSDSALRLLTERVGLPLHICGVIILALCALAWWTSYCIHGRDQIGYVVLIAFSGLWSGIYAVSRLLLDAPYAATQGALSWLLIGGLLILVARDPEVPLVDELLRGAK